MKKEVYWHHINDEDIYPKLEEQAETDTVIIGGGYTGLSTAYHLQKQNHNTIVLEKSAIGDGASGLNGSLMLVGYKPSFMKLSKQLGLQAAKEMLDLSLEGIELVKEIVHKYDIQCDLENRGSLAFACRESHLDNLANEQQFLLEKMNYKTTIISKEELMTEIDSPNYYGALLDENSCYFQPYKYIRGLARAVKSIGCHIYEGSEANEVKYINDKVHVKTQKGHVIANHIVFATNGYTDNLNPELNRRIIPMNSNMLATEPLDRELVDAIMPNRRGGFDTNNLLCYFRLTNDNRLVFGSRIRGKENNYLYERLMSSMKTVFPQLSDVKIDYRWGGKLAITLDLLPHIGVTEKGAHFAMGYSGHGVSLSTLMGKLISQNILQSSGKTILEEKKFKKIPLHNQKASLLNMVTYYFWLKDNFNYLRR